MEKFEEIKEIKQVIKIVKQGGETKYFEKWREIDLFIRPEKPRNGWEKKKYPLLLENEGENLLLHEGRILLENEFLEYNIKEIFIIGETLIIKISQGCSTNKSCFLKKETGWIEIPEIYTINYCEDWWILQEEILLIYEGKKLIIFDKKGKKSQRDNVTEMKKCYVDTILRIEYKREGRYEEMYFKEGLEVVPRYEPKE